jgi:hypothetical protein
MELSCHENDQIMHTIDFWRAVNFVHFLILDVTPANSQIPIAQTAWEGAYDLVAMQAPGLKDSLAM